MNSYQFCPTFRLTVFCGILSSILAAFGVWQLDRADEKESLQAAIEARTKMPRLGLNNLGSGARPEDTQLSEPLIHRNLGLQGHFVQNQQILLENIVRNSVNGYYVYTPLMLENGKAVLVNRGWLAAGRTRADIPQINTPASLISLSGRIANPRSKPVMPGELPLPDINSDKVWFYLDLNYLAAKTQLELLPFVLLQTSTSNDNLLREWPAFDGKTGMHIGYAIQWFVFSFAVLFAWIALSLSKRPSRSNTKDSDIAGVQNNA